VVIVDSKDRTHRCEIVIRAQAPHRH
jgi:hypothetical protein